MCSAKFVVMALAAAGVYKYFNEEKKKSNKKGRSTPEHDLVDESWKLVLQQRFIDRMPEMNYSLEVNKKTQLNYNKSNNSSRTGMPKHIEKLTQNITEWTDVTSNQYGMLSHNDNRSNYDSRDNGTKYRQKMAQTPVGLQNSDILQRTNNDDNITTIFTASYYARRKKRFIVKHEENSNAKNASNKQLKHNVNNDINEEFEATVKTDFKRFTATKGDGLRYTITRGANPIMIENMIYKENDKNRLSEYKHKLSYMYLTEETDDENINIVSEKSFELPNKKGGLTKEKSKNRDYTKSPITVEPNSIYSYYKRKNEYEKKKEKKYDLSKERIDFEKTIFINLQNDLKSRNTIKKENNEMLKKIKEFVGAKEKNKNKSTMNPHVTTKRSCQIDAAIAEAAGKLVTCPPPPPLHEYIRSRAPKLYKFMLKVLKDVKQ